jgi:F-type H+-transporting ATPase subunit delta
VATAAARRYGRAIFELAQSDADLDGWARRLARVREILGDPQVADVLSNPTISMEKREALIAAPPRVLDNEGTNLARLLIESGRTGEMAEIEEEFARLTDQAEGRVRATVTTAVALKAEDRDRVQKELSRRLNKDVRLTVAVDPRVIGGLKLQYGDHVVDASVATKLQQLRRRLAAS